MARPEMGERWVCAGCETRFFDFGRPKATCPSCGVEQPRRPRLSTAVRGGGALRWNGRGGATTPAVVQPVLEDAEVEIEDDAEEDDDAVPEVEDEDDLADDIVPSVIAPETDPA